MRGKLVSRGIVMASVIAGLCFAKSANAVQVWINEIHYDNASTDVGEFVEVAGTAGTDLNGWSLVFYNGTGGASYGTIPLLGILPDSSNGFGALSFPKSSIQNGPDGLALVDASSTLVQFLSYGGSFNAVGGVADGESSVDIGVSENSSTAIGHSLQLTGAFGAFTWTGPLTASAGQLNTGQTFSGSGVSSGTGGSSIPDAGASLTLLSLSLASLGLFSRRRYQT